MMVMSSTTKRSPRAPSVPLDEAIDRVRRVYDKENCHPAPADAVAQHLGYTNAKNGAAASAIATLRYYGLIGRGEAKTIVVSKEVQDYIFAPSSDIKKGLLVKWLRTPPVFGDLLDEYPGHLPSDETLKFRLVQKGFSPDAADACRDVFRRSVEFVGYYDDDDGVIGQDVGPSVTVEQAQASGEVASRESAFGASFGPKASQPMQPPVQPQPQPIDEDFDRIPVRLSGGRRAWVEVPSPLYKKDKERLKAQIDLLLTDDEDV
ncbi:hypothetical protein [Marinobacter adhaerens]|uniref:hypothetical protein n=2 Tax=Marinobacter adhaerens TaxID=1033846 RepID=UPI003D2E6FE0